MLMLYDIRPQYAANNAAYNINTRASVFQFLFGNKKLICENVNFQRPPGPLSSVFTIKSIYSLTITAVNLVQPRSYITFTIHAQLINQI